jgi:hypothetical protein
MRGKVEYRQSYAPKATSPIISRINAAKVCQEFHGNMMPPHERGIRKELALVTKRNMPMKSILWN